MTDIADRLEHLTPDSKGFYRTLGDAIREIERLRAEVAALKALLAEDERACCECREGEHE